MQTRVKINGADSIRSLESQVILHPEVRTVNLIHAIGEIKDAFDWILRRNSVAEAFIPLKLRQDSVRSNAWVPKTATINPKLNFRGIYQPLTLRWERLGLGRAADLPVVFNFSIHDLAGNVYTEGEIREMIRERAILELQDLLQRVDTELSGAIKVINQKYPDGKNTWKLVHQTQRAKILSIMSRI